MLRRPELHQRNRRYSWPPFKLGKLHRNKDIDEDPLSFFVSPPEEDSHQTVDTHMDADIERDVRPRSLSPLPVQNRVKILKSSTITKLRSWIQRMEPRYMSARPVIKAVEHLALLTPPASPEQMQMMGVKRPAPIDEEEEDCQPMFETFDITVSPPLRGRRPTRSSRRRYGDKMIRSHSKKARVWKEPDEDIWPVLEEPEERETGLGLGIRV